MGGGKLSCRDLITCQVLQYQGFDDVCMTGCPAWYDIELVRERGKAKYKEPKRIIISDPASKYFYRECLSLTDFIIRRFPNAEVSFVFHRGRDKDFSEELANRRIQILDIAGSCDGFEIYNECDLHIGYRVHAHIYNLSRRQNSILIEEDGRGAGVDQALGLPQIKAYSDQFQIGSNFFNKVYKRMPFYENRTVLNQIETYLKALEDTDNQYFKNAYSLQEKYFDLMISFIKGIGI